MAQTDTHVCQLFSIGARLSGNQMYHLRHPIDRDPDLDVATDRDTNRGNKTDTDTEYRETQTVSPSQLQGHIINAHRQTLSLTQREYYSDGDQIKT
jgi:hypothetical protein